jgi:hypothetical protein
MPLPNFGKDFQPSALQPQKGAVVHGDIFDDEEFDAIVAADSPSDLDADRAIKPQPMDVDVDNAAMASFEANEDKFVSVDRSEMTDDMVFMIARPLRGISLTSEVWMYAFSTRFFFTFSNIYQRCQNCGDVGYSKALCDMPGCEEGLCFRSDTEGTAGCISQEAWEKHGWSKKNGFFCLRCCFKHDKIFPPELHLRTQNARALRILHFNTPVLVTTLRYVDAAEAGVCSIVRAHFAAHYEFNDPENVRNQPPALHICA